VTTSDEQDVRSMLHRRAADVTPAPDAWASIQARLEADQRPGAVVRRHPFRVLAGGVAAAAVAALFVTQVLPGPPATEVRTPPTGTATQPDATVPDVPWVWPAAGADFPAVHDPIAVAAAYIEDRTGAVPNGGQLTTTSAGHGVVLYGRGPAVSEVAVVRAGDRWFVESASSDLLPMHMLTYDGTAITGELTAEAEGTLTLRYGAADGDPLVEDPRGPVAFRETIALEQRMAGEDWVTAGGVLQIADGTFAVTEGWQRNPRVTAVPDTTPGVADAYTGVFPAYTGEELARYDDAARTNGDTTYTDPRSTAGAFLGQLFPRDSSDVSYAVADFRQGDELSGEVAFTLSDGGRGVVAVRRPSGTARIWYVVTAFTEPALAIDVRVEGGGTTVEPAPGATVEVAELQPLPGGDVVTAEPADHLLRFEGVTDGIVRLVGSDADGRTALLVARVSSAG
jgi:hypothetical protein